jgi:hypothetical protein
MPICSAAYLLESATTLFCDTLTDIDDWLCLPAAACQKCTDGATGRVDPLPVMQKGLLLPWGIFIPWGNIHL